MGNNVVVNAPFDSSSFSYDGIINPLKTPLSQHPHQHQQQQQYQQHQQPQQQQQTSSSTHPLPTNTINNNGIYNIGAAKNGLPKQQIPLTSDFLQNPQQNPQHQLQYVYPSTTIAPLPLPLPLPLPHHIYPKIATTITTNTNNNNIIPLKPNL